VICGRPLLFRGVRGNVIPVTDEQRNKKGTHTLCYDGILKIKNGYLDILRFISLYFMRSYGVDAQKKQEYYSQDYKEAFSDLPTKVYSLNKPFS